MYQDRDRDRDRTVEVTITTGQVKVNGREGPVVTLHLVSRSRRSTKVLVVQESRMREVSVEGTDIDFRRWVSKVFLLLVKI